MERIREIDGLRAVAALSVFAHHAIGFAAIARFTGTGWVGVDLFFVISGYLITTILLGMRGDPHYFRNFYMRRTLRIFPPYYLFLAICFVCAILIPNYHPSWKLWASFALYATSLVVVRPWYAPAASALPMPANGMELTWSLSIEEFFYLLWAPAVRFLSLRLLYILVAFAILGAPAVRWFIHGPGWVEYFFFLARTDSLAFGALLALLRATGARLRVPGWLAVTALAACAAALQSSPNPRANDLFILFGYTLIAVTMALILSFVLDHADSNNVICRILRSRPLVWVGTISYMFYLLHLFVIRVVSNFFSSVYASEWALNRTLYLTTSLAATLLLSALSWRYFESPILRLKTRFAARRVAAFGAAQN